MMLILILILTLMGINYAMNIDDRVWADYDNDMLVNFNGKVYILFWSTFISLKRFLKLMPIKMLLWG